MSNPVLTRPIYEAVAALEKRFYTRDEIADALEGVAADVRPEN